MASSPASATSRASSYQRKRDALNISIEDFKAGMQRFAQMFTKNYGVKLVFRGSSAYTDGKMIVVPELSLLSRPNMTEKEIDEAIDFLMCTRGFVYHEGAHIIYSGDIKNIVRRAMRVGAKFKHLLNVLEDLRIERSISEVLPGAKEALIFMNEWLLASIVETVKERIAAGQALTPFAQTCYAIGLIGELGGNGRDHEMWSVLNEKTRTFATSIRGLIMRAKNADSPNVVYKIALEIWEMLKDEEQRRKEENKKKREREERKKKREEEKQKKQQDEESGDGAASPGDGDQEEEESKSKKKSRKKRDDSDDEDDTGSPSVPDDSDDSSDDDGAGEAGDEEGDDERGEDDGSESSSEHDDGDGDSSDDGGHGTPNGAGEDDEGVASAPGTPGDEEEKLAPDDELIGNEEDEADVSEDKEETIGRHVKEEVKKLLSSGEKVYRVYTTENDEIGPPEKPLTDQELQRLRQIAITIDAETRFAYGPVKRQLENLLKARTHSYYVRGLDSGELDPSALHRLASAAGGAPELRMQSRHVFQQQVAVQSLKSTVCMLPIDVSGSMGCAGETPSKWSCSVCGEKSEHIVMPDSVTMYHVAPGHKADDMPRRVVKHCPQCKLDRKLDLIETPTFEAKVSLAKKCAIVFAQALEGVHVPFEMFTWTTKDAYLPQKIFQQIGKRGPKELEEAQQLYTRFGGLKIVKLKEYSERWQTVQWRLATVKAEQCNYDGESLLYGARRLMERPEKRKVMFVLCDGIPGPCAYEPHHAHQKYLHEVIKEIRGTTPIEVVGIGIGAPAAQEFYKPRFVNVSNAHELPNVVIQQLKRALLT